MKRRILTFGAFLAGSLFFSSCTKSLKDDLKDLRNRVNVVEGILGSNEPIVATTTFVDDNDSTRKVSDTYSFKAGNYSTQYLYDNQDGTYGVYIERFSDVEWYEGAWVSFDYNPTTKAVTNRQGGHYWDDADNYNDNATYYSSINPAPTINITVNSFDLATGNISLNFSANGSEAYTNTAPNIVPNPGKPVSTSFSFTGKLKLFSSR